MNVRAVHVLVSPYAVVSHPPPPANAAWNLKEEVAVAALQLGKSKDAWPLIESILRQFPDSSRASRLLALHFECTKDFTKAEEIYKRELTQNPTNIAVLRRMVALKEGQGDVSGALAVLKEHLDVHCTDVIAWEHAASLYVRTGAYSQAIFCLEEVLLHQPGSANALLLMAEVQYAAGNYEIARGYYSGIIEITNGEHARALYGACSCVAQLGKKGGGGGEEGGLGAAAAEALRQLYAVKNPDKLGMVDAMLKAQGLVPR